MKTDWVLCDIAIGVATITLNNQPLNVITPRFGPDRGDNDVAVPPQSPESTME